MGHRAMTAFLLFARGIPILAYVCAVLFVWGGYERHGKVAAKRETAELRAKATQDALTISDALNDEDSRRTEAQGKATDEDQKREADRLAGDRRTSTAVGMLNARLAEQGRRLAAADTSTAQLRAAAATNRELFGSCAAEYRSLGSDAADARRRGLLTESLYDALRQPATTEGRKP